VLGFLSKALHRVVTYGYTKSFWFRFLQKAEKEKAEKESKKKKNKV
jgi:hypothetical protein